MNEQQLHDMMHRGLELTKKVRLTAAEEQELKVIVQKSREIKQKRGGITEDDVNKIVSRAKGPRDDLGDAFADPEFKLGVGRFTGKAIYDATKERFARSKAVIESGTMLVPASRDGELYTDPQAPRFVQDLIPSKLEASKTTTYIRQSARDNQAAVVPEGTQKPTSTYTLSEEEATVQQFAHLSEFVTNSLFEDASMLMGWLQSEMSYGLDLAIEADAVATIIADPGILTQVFATDIFTSIRKGVTKLQKSPNFITPTIMLLAPEDAEAIDLEQDGQQRYYFEGPKGAGSSPVWSVPVLVTDAAVRGSALLMNPGAGLRRYVRGTAKFDIDALTNFDVNETRCRLESRSVTVVNRPFAICLVDIGTPTS
jgi:HK97 family phage major capsid protein